jgi:hypothetical protein
MSPDAGLRPPDESAARNSRTIQKTYPTSVALSNAKIRFMLFFQMVMRLLKTNPTV